MVNIRPISDRFLNTQFNNILASRKVSGSKDHSLNTINFQNSD